MHHPTPSRGAVPLGKVAAALALVAAGCSLTLVDRVDCQDDAQCRTEFSLGSVCGDEGFCERVETPARCGKAFPEDFLDNPDRYADHILLGTLFSFTSHNDTLQAAELAVRQVNQNGGLDGQRYAIVHCDYEAMVGDDLDDIQAVEMLAPFLANGFGVPAIIGPRGSSRTEATYNAVRDAGVVVVSPSATSPALTALDGTNPTNDAPGFLWRTAPPDSLQSEVIAADMRARGVLRTAVIFQQGAYGDALANLFVQRFTEGGGASAEQFPFEAGSDFAASVATVGEAIDDGVEEVLFVSSDIDDYVKLFAAATATPNLERQYTEQLGSTLPEGGLFLADAAYSAMLLDATVGTSASLYAKVRGSRPAPAEGVLFDSFAASYTSTFNEDSTGSAYTPHAYDAAWLVIYGTAWSSFNRGEVSGLGIAQGLRRVSGGTPVDILPASWTTVVDSFRNGTGIDVDGASGVLDYDPATEETTAPVETWRIVANPDEASGFGFERIAVVNP
jgi:branched-chain amino acid transport system substrate-binding protein